MKKRAANRPIIRIRVTQSSQPIVSPFVPTLVDGGTHGSARHADDSAVFLHAVENWGNATLAWFIKIEYPSMLRQTNGVPRLPQTGDIDHECSLEAAAGRSSIPSGHVIARVYGDPTRPVALGAPCARGRCPSGLLAYRSHDS